MFFRAARVSALTQFFLCLCQIYQGAGQPHIARLHGGHRATQLRTSQEGYLMYSALYDPLDGQLIVNLEISHDFEAQLVRSCVVSTKNQTVELDASWLFYVGAMGNTTYWRPGTLTCKSPPSWSGIARLSLVLDTAAEASNLLLQFPHIRVEEIKQERVGQVGACIAPLFSSTPSLHDWLLHSRDMGIQQFYVYVPHGAFIDAENYTRFAGSFPEAGLRSRHPVRPFYSSTMFWYHLTPMQDSYYFAQMISYNDCIFRNRRRHDFLLLLDTDEFLFFDKKYENLQAFLESTLTPDKGAVQLGLSWHQYDCPREHGRQHFEAPDALQEDQPDVAYFSDRDPETWYNGAKCIVRPLNIVFMHVHNPLAVIDGVELMQQVPPADAAMRHIRCGSYS